LIGARTTIRNKKEVKHLPMLILLRRWARTRNHRQFGR
jgi:hypothetical protein